MSIFKHLLPGKKKSACRDNIVGARVKVVEPIDNAAGSGEVRVGTELWAARSVTDEVTFSVGETVQVVACEGVRLVCRK
ncbi:MAG TPA: hypothetical protein DDY70_00160 [Clostridiales bacterium]|nr:hypothetical protein [Clostridiales bacterium]